MDLTAKDAAKLLRVSEDTIYGWIRNGTLPSYRVKDRFRLNRVELLEWAGYAVAVANAHQRVLAVADFVCPPVTEEGVAQVIEAALTR